MRDVQAEAETTRNDIDMTAVWPVTAALAPMPFPEIDGPVGAPRSSGGPAVPNAPVAVGRILPLAILIMGVAAAIML